MPAQDHRGDGFDDHRLPREPTKGGHDGDRDQRADDSERIPDSEGEDAAEDRAVVRQLRCTCAPSSSFLFLVHAHLVLQGPVKSGSWPPCGFNRQPQPDRTTNVLRDRTERSVLERPDLTAVRFSVVTGL